MFVYNEKFVSKKEGHYYSCPWIEHGLVFFGYKLAMCCHCGHQDSSQMLLRNNFTGQKIDWDRIFKVKDMYRNFHKKGKIHSNDTNINVKCINKFFSCFFFINIFSLQKILHLLLKRP